ncbi:UbiX family flavin prenyltransferase [Rhizobium mayense]|uniref:Flavin prenyltransferase UbiX n=1 Tax=Rhizobium mayense TaxID=1312184 RepID=A0ABT7K5I2_9HYPH|nr:UbiX family flavin prenyltransferase [Rhizobium mayense]MDL2403875.1 UbiX family flavin prenyltransferase [Rhizobium mayense]
MTFADRPFRVVVAITGASGAVLGETIVKKLMMVGAEVHLVVSEAGQRTLAHEIGSDAYGRLLLAATKAYDPDDIGSAIASGSFRVDGMIIAPCSMKTLAAIACGVSDNLIIRAADVQLKERRRLILLARETPLHLGHLRNMTSVTEMGAIVMPPVPAFYQRPLSVADVVDHIASRAIDMLGLPMPGLARSWEGERGWLALHPGGDGVGSE